MRQQGREGGVVGDCAHTILISHRLANRHGSFLVGVLQYQNLGELYPQAEGAVSVGGQTKRRRWPWHYVSGRDEEIESRRRAQRETSRHK